MSLFISVVVCTYNRNQVLCDALEKLLNQDYPNYELLVIDQSKSHDETTTAYLESIKDRIRLIKPPFANLPKARNFSLNHTHGEIISFFDDDMDVPPDTLSKLAKTYTENSNVSILTGFLSQNHEIDFVKYAGYAWGKPVNQNSGIKELEQMDGGFMSFRKSALDRIGGFDEWIGTQMAASGEDHEYCQRARVAGYKIYINTNIVVENKDLSEGGSERAKVDPDFRQQAMTFMKFYICIKNRPYKGFMGWVATSWTLYRFHILNRSLKTTTLTELLERHRQYKNFYKRALDSVHQFEKEGLKNIESAL